uniref:acid phosphatase n=1 Tax=Homalodisca liturata TaxID=320908 RepID=A0A1B6JGN8_9HEMI
MVSTSIFVQLAALVFCIVVIIYTFSLSMKSMGDETKVTNSNGTRVSDSLKFAVIISRHGNRGPLFNFPNSPYPVNDTKYWPYGIGQLTTVGRDQMYNLGIKIRVLYNGFLNSMYYNKDFYASSTAIDRALLSGEAFLAGLYPPTGFQLWDKEILWQPIPIYSNSPDKSQDLNECPRYMQERLSAGKIYIADNYTNLTAVVNYLNRITGANLTSILGLFISWDTLTSEEVEGYILPEWTKKVYPQPMNDLAGKLYYSFFASTYTICRLVMGNFVDEMLTVMKSVVNGTLTPDRKMYFYSGHDISLVTLQAILGIPQTSMFTLVAPGSGMVLELHQDPNTEEFSVQVLYIDGSSPDLKVTPLVIPGCGTSCGFDQFLDITQKFTNVSFEKECQLNSDVKRDLLLYYE